MIKVSSFGNLREDYTAELIQRTKRLMPFEWNQIRLKKIPDKRPPQLLPEEQKFLSQNSDLILLDRGGRQLDDDAFYKFCFSESDLHFVIGPAFGFHPDFIAKSSKSISLSSLTLTHGLAQAVLAESIYRVACRMKNHPFVK